MEILKAKITSNDTYYKLVVHIRVRGITYIRRSKKYILCEKGVAWYKESYVYRGVESKRRTNNIDWVIDKKLFNKYEKKFKKVFKEYNIKNRGEKIKGLLNG